MIHEQPGGRVWSKAEGCLGPGVGVTDVTPLLQGELEIALSATVRILLTFLSPSLSLFPLLLSFPLSSAFLSLIRFREADNAQCLLSPWGPPSRA